jgi:UDP:flavonoid glycosyltransferase YjiC (YdhE family)
VPIEDHPFFDAPFSPHGTAALFSSQLTAPRPDWPQGVRITGHIPYSGATQSRLPDAVCHFLDAGSEPIVFVMGSWSAMSAAFFTESADACRRLGRRGLIVAPGIDGLDFGPDVLVTGYLPVDLLFGRAAAIVHHGGMGTLQHAMLAGKVMVVVPHFLDQFGNAWLACRLGTARALQPARYRGATAAAALHALLSDAAAHRRAGAVAAQMRAEDGVAQACAFVETATSGSGRPAACLPA